MLGKDEAQRRNALRKSRSESGGRVGLGDEDRKGVRCPSLDGLKPFTWLPGLPTEALAVSLETAFNTAPQGKKLLSPEWG